MAQLIRQIWRALIGTALRLLAAGVVAIAAPCAAQASSALAKATHDLCGKQLVLLGEADHGDGATVEFKAALVQELITKCGFNALYFESGTYDFLKVEEMVREAKRVDAATLSSAIGGIWDHDTEIGPLIGFLIPRVNSGEVRIGGIDDQIGSAGAFYSLDRMHADLATVLRQERRNDCREQMLRRANHAYSDEHPHDTASIASLDRCLAEIEQRMRSGRVDLLTEDRLQMVAAFRRAIARDFIPISDFIPRRDRGMYENLRWLMARAGSHRKTVVWTANDHAAKSTGISDYASAPNLGTLVHRAYGSRAFALGISAAGGSNYSGRKEPSRPISQAAPESVEGQALAASGQNEEAVYVPAAQLRRVGAAPGSFSHHKPRTAHWDQLFDGVVILRTERPPARAP